MTKCENISFKDAVLGSFIWYYLLTCEFFILYIFLAGEAVLKKTKKKHYNFCKNYSMFVNSRIIIYYAWCQGRHGLSSGAWSIGHDGETAVRKLGRPDRKCPRTDVGGETYSASERTSFRSCGTGVAPPFPCLGLSVWTSGVSLWRLLPSTPS